MLWAFLALLFLVGRSGSSSGGSTTPSGGGGGSVTPKQQLWAKVEAVPELDVTQRYFLMLTAYGETGGTWRPTAHNDTPSEVAASRNGIDNNASLRERLAACGISSDDVAIGSVGLFQRLGPYWADDMLDIFGSGGCQFARPIPNGFDTDLAIVSAIKNARTLQGYDSFKADPTVGRLRLGWASTATMNNGSPERIEKYRKHAEAVHLPAGVVDWKIARFPGNYVEIFQRLKGTT